MVSPKLTIPIEEAHRRINVQIRRGHAIQKYRIFSESDLDLANIQRTKWYDETKNLLELMDDNEVLVKQFHYLTPTLSSGEMDFTDKVHSFRYHMDKDMRNLQSIYGSIGLLQDLTIHAVKIKKTKKPRKLTPAQEKKCWDINPHICNLCGKDLHGISETEFEHTKAFAKGGNTDLTNVKLSHRSCNKQKGTKSLKTARKMLGYNKNIKKTSRGKNRKKEKVSRQKTTHFIDERSIVKEHDQAIFSANLEKDDIISGRIKSDLPISVYVVDNTNLEKFDEFEVEFEVEVEEVINYSMNFVVPKTRVWNLVLVNTNSKSTNIDIKLFIKTA